MSDPERLTRRPPNTTLGALMRAGLAERPDEVSVRRTLKAVAAFAGLGAASSGAGAAAQVAGGAAAGAAGSAAPAATLATPILLVKWLAGGAAGGVLLSVGVHQAFAPAPQVSQRPAAQLSVPGPARARPASDAPTPTVRADEAPHAPYREPQRAAEPSADARVAAAHQGSQTAGLGTPGVIAAELAAEVSLVDTARARLSANDARAALVTLRDYERRFPERQLYTEVLAVRMEASHALGNEADARAFAKRLLERGVARPLAERARLLAE